MLALARRPMHALLKGTPLAKNLTSASATAVKEVTTYGSGVQFFHWVMGTALAGATATVLLAQDTPKEDKEKKARYMFLHKSW